MQRRQLLARVASIVVVLIGCVAAPGCKGPVGPEATQAPPPPFNYLTDEQLDSAMWQLAAGITQLDSILGPQEPITRSQRLEVMRILDRMMVAADELGPDGVSTNHPRITQNLGRFRETLAIARSSVAMQPPRYYLVGSLSGACLACHASP